MSKNLLELTAEIIGNNPEIINANEAQIKKSIKAIFEALKECQRDLKENSFKVS